MINAKDAIFVTHFVLLLAFILSHSLNSWELTIALLFHYLILTNDSSCYPDHCILPASAQHAQKCVECNIKKWIRMRHCYKCNRCVHKYDHHCVLMDICIGQFNHRYYLLFLICFLYNIGKMLYLVTLEIRDEVSIDQLGIESFSAKFYMYAVGLMFLYFLLILTGYLMVYHIYLCCNNATTWQLVKRDSIGYLRHIDPQISHPFSCGIWSNLKQVFMVDREQPVAWVLPAVQLRLFNSTDANY